MASERFDWNAWLTPGIDWFDPIPVLEAHMDPALVEAMLRRGD